MKTINNNQSFNPLMFNFQKFQKKTNEFFNQGNQFYARLMNTFLRGAFVFFLLQMFVFQVQAQIPNEAEWNGGGFSLKKITSNTTIPSGVNFSYTIMFSAPAGATTINIADEIPASLVVVSVPTPANVNGVTPSVTISGTPGINEVVSYSLTGLPVGSASSGSFTIVVKFPEGITCNGTAARNRARILTDDWHYTPFVSTTATADNPWKVVKSILSGPVVNPSGGSCGYLIEPGYTLTYRLSVLKKSPYYGNVVGQQNMTSAVVTDVLPAGAIMLTSTCGIPANSTGTITWNPNSGTLNAATPYAYYYCDITVYYPAVSFPIGSFINNQLSLDGLMCGQQVSQTSNETCIEVANIVANPNGYFNKSIYLTNRVPGCQGFYQIAFCNTGNVPLSAFNINDVIPSGISVNSVVVYGGNATTSLALYANSGGNTISSSITSSYFNSGTLGFTANDLQLQMTGSLPVGQCIYMYVYFTVEPNPTGTVVTNCASFDGLSNSLSLPQACVSFTVDEGEPRPCILKDVCSPQASYEPGDVVRFRIRVQNIGSADISGASFMDNLHSNFTYVGNESYYVASSYNPPCSSGGGIPAGTSAWTGLTTNHSGNNLEWMLPDIPSDCQLFYVGYCGYYGTWGLPYYFIEFDAMVDSMALPGVTPNFYEINGGNLAGTSTSNTTYTLVVASFGQEVYKQVSTDNGSTFASTAAVTPGGNARYRLNYKNTSNVTVSSVNLVDLLPLNDGSNDWLVLNRTVNRGSQFGVGYNNNHGTSLSPSGTPPTGTNYYANGTNICLPAFGINSGCTPISWSTSPTEQNIRVDYGAYLLNPNTTIHEDFDVTIPVDAGNQETACNDFAAISTANFLLDGTPTTVALTPIAAPPICVVVDTTTSSCCDSIRIEQYADATGNDCCVRIVTECEVKSIMVTVTNGTISSTSWNCGNVPTGYSGQSSYTFGANGCAIDMINCFKPEQNGTITVTYTIIFQNGEECEKTIELDCGSSECCDAVKLELVQDPDLQDECCARLVTQCEVDSIVVNVGNGTLANVSWNCGTSPSGYVGQSSFTFNAGLCAVDMIVCVDAIQSGTVSISYTIYFANGEICEKSIELNCKAEVNCCDSVDVRQLINADGMTECCAQIRTKCEVDSILVALTNGTFSSNTWNCGTTIPAAAIGQSSYTFVANNCVVNMTNCIDANQTGTVSISYTIYFANGEICEKSIEFDCKAEVNCCDSIDVRQLMNADGTTECCAQIRTKCEVDSISVALTNGTFSSNTWNCGTTIPAAAIGQSSYTFVANNCVVNMTNCIDAIQTGTVTILYTIYFTNGEKCEKSLQFDCEAAQTNCCDSIQIETIQDPVVAGECCVQLQTDCEVDSIQINVNNGSISTLTTNCGTIPTGYVGESSYTFDANLCAVDMIACFTPTQTGTVSVSYTIYMQNGEICQKAIELDCKVDEINCCDSVKVERIINSDTGECCAKITTDCDVESIAVSVSNGTISSTNWNCGTVPGGFAGQSNFTFQTNGCVVEMSNCFSAIQTGPVVVNYVITFLDGTTCEKSVTLDCKVEESSCCALVDFKLKQKWPFFATQVGTFSITNLDPSVPICSVTISANPTGSFTTGGLIIDGIPSTQSWTPSSIPASGSLSPSAINSMVFSLIGTNYHGTITVCVVKCDGTECCFEFKWNKKVIIDIGIDTGQLPHSGKLLAVTLNPVVTTSTSDKVKYVSFGMSNEQEVANSEASFFAISASEFQGDDYPENLAAPVAAYMSKSNAFFELSTPKMSGENLGAFNLVFSKKLPELGCTLFDEEGNILFSGEIEVTLSDSINTSVINESLYSENMFEFIKLYPNPSNGAFNITYATGNQRSVEIRVINPVGQVIDIIQSESDLPGIHNIQVNTQAFSQGLYKVVLYSEGKVLSKSAVIKK